MRNKNVSILETLQALDLLKLYFDYIIKFSPHCKVGHLDNPPRPTYLIKQYAPFNAPIKYHHFVADRQMRAEVAKHVSYTVIYL